MKKYNAIIYALFDPIEDTFFYIGRTCKKLNRRLRQHINKSFSSESEKAIRIQKIISCGCDVGIVELDQIENATRQEIIDLENDYIKQARELGLPITNLGDGAFGCLEATKKTVIPSNVAAVLGTDSDQNIADRYGFNKTRIREEREILGIPAYRPKPDPIVWSKKFIDMLGELPDTHIAVMMNVDFSSVRYKRESLNIPTYYEKYKKIDLTDELIADLGKLSDPNVAKKYGYTPTQILKLRKSLNISAIDVSEWQRFKLPQGIIDRLGKEPDYILAKKIGTNKTTIKNARKRLGIKPCGEVRVKIKWSNEMIENLFKMRIDDFSEKYKISMSSVNKKRKELKNGKYSIA